MSLIDAMNTSGIIYNVFNGITVNTTGSDYLTMLLILLFILLGGLILRMPFELIALCCIPLILVMMAFDIAIFGAVGVFILIYLGVVFAKNLLFSKF